LLRNDDDPICVIGHPSAKDSQDPAGGRDPAILAENAIQVAAMKRDHEGQTLRERQKCALPPMSMNNVVTPARKPVLCGTPGADVIARALPAPEVKDIDLNPRLTQGLHLSGKEDTGVRIPR
jgi:hypothetical protein